MALTREQARELSKSLADVFTLEGDAGVIDRLRTFTDPKSAHYGKGQCALVVGANVHEWVPVADLESAETLKERAEAMKKLHKQYPYIFAWGVDLGSLWGWSEMEADIAAADNAPKEVIYRRDFGQITQSERDRALEEEKSGAAYIIRDANGNPTRVWYTVRSCQSEDVRNRVTKYAENLERTGTAY